MIIENYKTENITERESGSEAYALAVDVFSNPQKMFFALLHTLKALVAVPFIVLRAFETYKLSLINDANGTNNSLF